MTFLPPGLVQLVQKCNHGIIIVLAGTLPESRKCVEGSGAEREGVMLREREDGERGIEGGRKKENFLLYEYLTVPKTSTRIFKHYTHSREWAVFG